MMALSPHFVHSTLPIVTATQPFLLMVGLICAWASERTYPAMRAYLLLNTIWGALTCGMQAFPTLLAGHRGALDGGLFWVAYGLSGVLTFLTAQQIFRDALQ